MIYLYALGDGIGEMSDLRGVAGEPIMSLPLAHATLLCGSLAQPPAISRPALLDQDRVVRALHARSVALLPIRFGTAMADRDAAARAVDALGPGLRARLNLVRGREQMVLRILTGGTGAGGARGAVRFAGAAGATGATGATGTRAASGVTGAGRAYLEARAAEIVPDAIRPLLVAVRSLQRAMRVEPGRHAGVIATVYQLIERGTAETYCRAIEEAAARLPAVTVRISGPAPPAAFASAL